ncbi:MAG: DUF4358 domain-containing protein [Lachnospiraceae bacterium]|jgi:hypothetical protein|nr:DUF4358 domain-containing protein [Lachnospiraceae bacterium]
MGSSGKRYGIVLWVMLLGMAEMLAGCAGASSDSGGIGGRAYADEGEGADDAVNTLQVGGKYRIVTPMMELKEAVVDILGDNYWPDALFSEEELAERTGISSNMYENFMAEYQHSEAGIDMMILVEAREDSIGDVERYLNEYRELLLKIYDNQPQNRAKIFASRIETIQNYVCYVQLGADITQFEEQGEEQMIAYCQQENERAVDILEKKILSRAQEEQEP